MCCFACRLYRMRSWRGPAKTSPRLLSSLTPKIFTDSVLRGRTLELLSHINKRVNAMGALQVPIREILCIVDPNCAHAPVDENDDDDDDDGDEEAQDKDKAKTEKLKEEASNPMRKILCRILADRDSPCVSRGARATASDFARSVPRPKLRDTLLRLSLESMPALDPSPVRRKQQLPFCKSLLF